jgi:hypothetical protein
MAVILDPSGLLFKGHIIAQGGAGGDPVKGFFKVSTALFLTSMVAISYVLLLLRSRQSLCSQYAWCVCEGAWQGILFA